MAVYLVWYESTTGEIGLWGIYASKELAIGAKELIEGEQYGKNVIIYSEEVRTSV